jgi:hypothetical protein
VGLRYDWLMTPAERYNRFVVFDPAANTLNRVGTDIDNIYGANHAIQPRLGLVWDPFKDGKTSIRAGYAILADQPVTNLITGATTNPPLAAPSAYVQPTPTSRTTFGTALADAKAAGLTPTSVDGNFHNAYVQSWNLNVQREVTQGLGLTIGYVGSKGTNLRIQRNINQIRSNGTRPFPGLSATSSILAGAGLGNIFENSSAGNSSYNALWITASKRLGRGLQFNASYTFSKSIDYNSLNSQGVVVQDSYNIRGDRGLSDYDARHRFVVNWIYELPFKGNRLVEGWQFSSITQLQSGNPINVIVNYTGLTGTATLRPDLIGPIEIIGKANPGQWFTNTVCDPRPTGSCPANSVFALPVSSSGVFHFGSLGRNVITGPNFQNVDFSILKTTKINERLKVQFRTEIFDLFNHANLGQPGRVISIVNTPSSNAAFGVITGTNGTRFPTGDSGSSRQLQFALKLIF